MFDYADCVSLMIFIQFITLLEATVIISEINLL